MTDRASHRAAVEAGYASLPAYVEKYRNVDYPRLPPGTGKTLMPNGEPKYPGETIRQTLFEWPGTREVGDVRIMDYGKDSKTRYRVACFCPGRLIDDIPGDTPKTEPECDKWCAALKEANEWFDLYVDREKRDGWTVRIEDGQATNARDHT